MKGLYPVIEFNDDKKTFKVIGYMKIENDNTPEKAIKEIRTNMGKENVFVLPIKITKKTAFN